MCNNHNHRVILNARKKDPTGTTILRKRYADKLSGAFRKLITEVNKYFKADPFGLKLNPERARQVLQETPFPNQYAFLSDPQKIEKFNEWLQEEIDNKVLSVDQTGFITNAYSKGVEDAFFNTRKRQMFEKDSVYANMDKETFLRSAFTAGTHTNSLEVLYTRNFQALKGITDALAPQMTRVFTDGLTQGLNPNVIAKNLNDRISAIGITRARTLARTEVIRAHAEGTLTTYESFGIEGVKVQAEWSTAGDNRVCPLCRPLEGVVMTIKEAKGSIPRHPNCRCAWLPADIGEDRKGQKRGKEKQAAIKKSIKAEGE